MNKNKIVFKNFICYFVFCLFILSLVSCRLIQLFMFTNLQTGLCYEFKFFEIAFYAIVSIFCAIYFIFFKYFYKFEFDDINFFKRSFILSLTSFLASVIILIHSIYVLLEYDPEMNKKVNLSFLLCSTGVCFALSFLFLSICFLRNEGQINGLKVFFIVSFIWASMRLIFFMISDAFLRFSQFEYKIVVLGCLTLFLFLFYLGQTLFDFNRAVSIVNMNFFGFFASGIILTNSISKIILQFYGELNQINFSSNYFKQNLNLLNIYSFNVVDFIVAVFILIFLIYFNKSKLNKK